MLVEGCEGPLGLMDRRVSLFHLELVRDLESIKRLLSEVALALLTLGIVASIPLRGSDSRLRSLLGEDHVFERIPLVKTTPAALLTVRKVKVRLLESANIVLLLVRGLSCPGVIHDNTCRHDRSSGYFSPATQQVESLALRRCLNFEAVAINLLSRCKMLH